MGIIKLETGIKKYDIENEHGDIIGQISFNANDINLLTRLYNFGDEISALAEEFTDAEVDDIVEKTEAADTKIKAHIDEVFGAGTAQAIFGNQSVFSELAGVSFIERFTEAIIPVIMNDINENIIAKAEKINKYKAQVYEQ